MPLKRPKAVNGRCQATTKAGCSCQAPPLKGQQYCAFHLQPDRASDLGRLGGSRNRLLISDPGFEVLPPRTAEQVRDVLSEVVSRLCSGRIETRSASALAYVTVTLLRSIEIADLEKRITTLEERNGTAATPGEVGKSATA